MSKQLNLFDERVYVETKSYVVYKSPSPGYECFLTRYCLTTIRNGDQSITLVEGSKYWKSEEFVYGFAKDKKKLYFLMFRNGDKHFARYANIYLFECISNCCIKVLHVSLTFGDRSIYLRIYKIIQKYYICCKKYFLKITFTTM